MTQELAVPEIVDAVEMQPVGNLFGTADPNEVVERATKTATALLDVVRNRRLIVKIGQSDHVKVEAWTLLGSMLGVFPVVQWTRKLEDGWEARVEAKTLAGATVGAAEAECLRSERNWKSSDDYAIRSMAQTRAVSKAMRGPLGFIVELAGFNPTPAEEMPTDGSLVSEPADDRAKSADSDPSDPVLTFGKYKGKRVSEIEDKGYVKWLAENAKDEAVRAAAEAELLPF